MIAAQLITMLQMQDRLNRRVHPDWINQNFDWGRAILVEAVELLDHIGWKWWKKSSPDLEQIRLELVDIWHFVLSMHLQQHRGNIQAAALDILEQLSLPLERVVLVISEDEKPLSAADLDAQRLVEVLGCVAGLSKHAILPVLAHLCEHFGLSAQELMTRYICKNVLNLFRQDHGYNDGTYIKTWSGREDNEVLMDLVMNMPELLLAPDELMAQLKARYSAVA